MNNAADLINENSQLKRQLDASKEKLKVKTSYIQQLEEMIKQFQSRQFGPSSEKISPNQMGLGLFNEPEESEKHEDDDQPESTTDVASHTRKKKPRVSIPEAYPREEIIYDLSDADKYCPHDGTALKHIGHEDHEQLDLIPAQVKVLRHRRLKYACPCCDQHIVTAKKPKQPIEKSIASPGLLAYIAIQKYCDSLPLYRQSEILSRLGIQLDRTNLASWMVKCGELLQPLINVMMDQLHQAAVVHMDETVLQVLNESGKTAQSKSYMWVMASNTDKPVTVFHYAPTRAQSVPLSLLSSDTKAIVVDGYEGYQAACDQYDITRIGCWAHARRKFIDAQKIQTKGKTGRADQALSYIQKLYRIEKDIKDRSNDDRYRIRQEKAKPLIDKIRQWLEKGLPHVPPKSALGKAFHYLHNQWDRLIVYLENGAYPIDNNFAENKIRPFVIGRKNWLFSASEAGAKSSANLYSLVETAKANKLNPYDYLKSVFTQLPCANSLEDVEALLPWNMKLV